MIVLILVIVLVLMGVLGAFDQEDTGDKEDRRRLRAAVELFAVVLVVGGVDARKTVSPRPSAPEPLTRGPEQAVTREFVFSLSPCLLRERRFTDSDC